MIAGRHGIQLVVAFSLLWALVELLAGQVLHRYSGYQVVWMRYLVHLLLMLLLWGWRQPATLWRTRRPIYQLSRSALMLLMPASWIVASGLGVGAESTMGVFWLAPLLVVTFARFVLGERPRPAVWLIALVASVGAMCIYSPRSLSLGPPLLLPLSMGLSFSLYVVMTRSLRDEPVRANLFYTALGVFLLLTPAMPGLWVPPDAHAVLVMAGVGSLGFLCLLALDRACEQAEASTVAPLCALQIVFMTLISIAGGQHPGRRDLLGLVLITGSAIAVWALAFRGAQGAAGQMAAATTIDQAVRSKRLEKK